MTDQNSTNKRKAMVNVEVDPSLKEAYKTWVQNQGFATEAEAIRFHMRTVTGFGPESQGQSPPTSGG